MKAMRGEHFQRGVAFLPKRTRAKVVKALLDASPNASADLISTFDECRFGFFRGEK
jgi:hypothetical protein